MLPRWGMAGAPLLPRALRDAWAHEELPAWLQAELSEAGARRFSDLSVSAISPGKSLSERGKALLVWHVKSRLAEIQDLPAVSDLNLQVSVDFIPWTTRTRNAVRSAVWKRQLPASPLDWTLLRIRDFMAIPNLGPGSYLDFACTLEASTAADVHSQSEVDVEAPGSTEAEVIEIESWMRFVSHSDPRFREHLPLGGETLAELVESFVSEVGGDAREKGAQLREAVIRSRFTAEKVSALSLERAIEDYVGRLTGLKGDRLRECSTAFRCLASLECTRWKKSPAVLESPESERGSCNSNLTLGSHGIQSICRSSMPRCRS